jgi:hypothetical protein
MWNFEGRSTMQIAIQISKQVDDWDKFVDELEAIEVTARAEDYDEEAKVVTLLVDKKSIDDHYHPVGGRYPVEFEGRKEFVEEIGICVHSCKWQDHNIINAEEVCAKLEGLDYVN